MSELFIGLTLIACAVLVLGYVTTCIVVALLDRTVR